MKAGYLVANWINNRMRSMGYRNVVNILASKIGGGLAGYFVNIVARYGVTTAAGIIAAHLGYGSSLAGPLGFIVGYASGYL